MPKGLIALLAALALVAGACGDDDDSGGAFGAGNETPQTETDVTEPADDPNGFGEDPPANPGGGNSFDELGRSEFMAGCDPAGAQTAVCSCMWDELTSVMSVGELAQLGDVNSPDDLPPEVQAAILSCL